VTDVAVLQLQRPGQVAPGPVLPSCIYLPSEQELSPEAIRLPWDAATRDVVANSPAGRAPACRAPGGLGQELALPSGVDRSAPILPWGGHPDVQRLSPVEASARLLKHLIQSWDFVHPDAPLADQEVVITVPASFDEVARALTVSAARQAGMATFTLVEEPQAAFYDFTARHRRDLARSSTGFAWCWWSMWGGGTTDFTLVQVGVSPEGPRYGASRSATI